MKKRKNQKNTKSKFSKFKFLFLIVFPMVIVIFGFLFLQTEIKFLEKKMYENGKKLEIVQNQLESKLVAVQKLSSEGRIVDIVKSKLGMVRINNKVEYISINQLKIDHIKKIVDSKYE